MVFNINQLPFLVSSYLMLVGASYILSHHYTPKYYELFWLFNEIFHVSNELFWSATQINIA